MWNRRHLADGLWYILVIGLILGALSGTNDPPGLLWTDWLLAAVLTGVVTVGYHWSKKKAARESSPPPAYR